jgi:hypothetical protein
VSITKLVGGNKSSFFFAGFSSPSSSCLVSSYGFFASFLGAGAFFSSLALTNAF